MTKKAAVDRLMSLYQAEAKWRGFFERTVDELNGDENIVTEDTYSQIIKHLNSFT